MVIGIEALLAHVLLEEPHDLLGRVIRVDMAAIVDDKLNRRVGRVDLPGGLNYAFLGLEIHNHIVRSGDVEDWAGFGRTQ